MTATTQSTPAPTATKGPLMTTADNNPHTQNEVPCDVRPWVPEDGDTRCQLCGQRNVAWFAPNDLWNAVMGGADGVLCPMCFVRKAEATDGFAAPPAWVLTNIDPAERPWYPAMPLLAFTQDAPAADRADERPADE